MSDISRLSKKAIKARPKQGEVDIYGEGNKGPHIKVELVQIGYGNHVRLIGYAKIIDKANAGLVAMAASCISRGNKSAKFE